MLNDSQRAVFRMVADNRAMFECLKEFLELKFTGRIYSEGLTNEDLGAIARAQYEGLQRIEQAFTEIASCRSSVDNPTLDNPAR